VCVLQEGPDSPLWRHLPARPAGKRPGVTALRLRPRAPTSSDAMGITLHTFRLLPLLFVLLTSLAALPRTARGHAEGDTVRKAVAVLYFVNNTGEARYDPFGKGLASMMITDLSSLDYVLLVEREHLESLIEELHLQQSSLFDQETALQVGRFVGAEYVITGSITALKPEIRLDTRVIQVETSEIVKAAEVSGRDNELFQLQGALADALIEGLDIALSPEEREKLRLAREANRIDEVETALAFSEALDHYDRENYVEALERMNYVRQHAPASHLVALTFEEIRKDVATKGKRELKGRLNGLLRRLRNN
jgi:TolB-like protein